MPGIAYRNCCCDKGSSTPAGRAWTGKHELWLRTQRFDTPGLQQAYDAAFDAMLRPWIAAIASTARSTSWPPTSVFTPVVTRLGCLRGVSTLTAFGLAVEIGDWDTA